MRIELPPDDKLPRLRFHGTPLAFLLAAAQRDTVYLERSRLEVPA